MTLSESERYVHVVSHGPQCLDGVTAAVVVAAFHPDTHCRPLFCSNTGVNRALREFRCPPQSAVHELWITDISWTDPAADAHLTNLEKQGVRIFWIDHHRTAIERFRSGQVRVPFFQLVLDESFAASRLTFEFLRQWRPHVEVPPYLAHLVELADDHDRWLHRFSDSHALALAVNALNSEDSFLELLAFARTGQWTERLQAAYREAQAAIEHSMAVAEQSRCERALTDLGIALVTAVCDGYPSEVADRWNATAKDTVFALFDLRSQSVSFRRSPDCAVDVSQVARRLGGGGHPAAAGCEIPHLLHRLASAVADAVEPALRGGG